PKWRLGSGRMPSAGWMLPSLASPGWTCPCRSARRSRRSTRREEGSSRRSRRCSLIEAGSLKLAAASCPLRLIFSRRRDENLLSCCRHEHNEQSPATGDVHQRGLERRRCKRTVRSATVGQGLFLDQLLG